MRAKNKAPDNCIDCKYHRVWSDPDPADWFCDDDKKVVCSKLTDQNGDFSTITTACRPYNLRKESERPVWCPLLSKPISPVTGKIES